jgi:hypothetical protein
MIQKSSFKSIKWYTFNSPFIFFAENRQQVSSKSACQCIMHQSFYSFIFKFSLVPILLRSQQIVGGKQKYRLLQLSFKNIECKHKIERFLPLYILTSQTQNVRKI